MLYFIIRVISLEAVTFSLPLTREYVNSTEISQKLRLDMLFKSASEGTTIICLRINWCSNCFHGYLGSKEHITE